MFYQTRSELMSRIRSHGNKDTELVVANYLRQHHITGWRRKQKIFGKPDFVFRRQQVAVFVDGCFWHGCPQHGNRPATNRTFWRKKFAANKARDQRVNKELRRQGWRVVRIWEHSLKNSMLVIQKIRKALE